MGRHVAAPLFTTMEYKFEHIIVETPDDEWLDELARMFAEIIYIEMLKENEQESDLV
jgi:hypothetical protein